MRQVKGEERKWRGYTPGEVRTMITGKLEEMIEADLITWHEDEQVGSKHVEYIGASDHKFTDLKFVQKIYSTKFSGERILRTENA